MSDIAKILITEDQIKQRVKELGQQISEDYPDGNLVLIGILKGAVVFLADLMREIKTHVEIDFMSVSSYGTASESSGVVRILKDLDLSIEGRDILIVEDIVDTGLTLAYLKDLLQSRNPKSVKIAAFLDKPERRKIEISADYLGYSVPDEFLVGYGLDYAERYRYLPYVAVLSPHVYNK
ncbi:MAG: hypoxanthine phosphoribosyltransferase [Firmicutes bacterium]|nr:hypoxanthine phosphoribosyltransferase [Bacillota bacterium]